MSTEFSKELLNDATTQDYAVFPKAPSFPAESLSNSNMCGVKAGQSSIRFDHNGHRVMDFFTDYGTQRVSIDGDLSSGKPIIMTFHDIGINHSGCFLSFFNMIRAYDAKFRYFTIVHVDAPGHHSHGVDSSSSTSSRATATAANASSSSDLSGFDFGKLAEQIEEVRRTLQIDRFIAFGVGSGCSVWTQYALRFGKKRLRGSILINPVGSGPSWKEWIFDSMLRAIGAHNSLLAQTFQGSLLARYFPGNNVASETYDFLEQLFSEMDHVAAIRYFRGFVAREEMSSEMLKPLRSKTLVICGEFSKVKEETIAFQQMMPRQFTQFVLLEKAGFLLTESCPQKIAKSVDLFVESLGITTISMQNKFGKLPAQIAC